jgi:DNA-binding FrmR family transcriptional regulator
MTGNEVVPFSWQNPAQVVVPCSWQATRKRRDPDGMEDSSVGIDRWVAANGRRRRVLNRYLTQVSAATKALQSVAVGVLDAHLRHCVVGAASAGDGAELYRLIAEADAAMDRLVKA